MAQFPEFRFGGIFRPKDAETHPLPDNTVPRTEHFRPKARPALDAGWEPVRVEKTRQKRSQMQLQMSCNKGKNRPSWYDGCSKPQFAA
jgi:hypothetical protein